MAKYPKINAMSKDRIYRYGKEVINDNHVSKAEIIYGEAKEISRYIPYLEVPDDKNRDCTQLVPVVNDKRFPVIHGVEHINSFSIGTHFLEVHLTDTRTEPNKILIISENGIIDTIVGGYQIGNNIGLISSYKMSTYNREDDNSGVYIPGYNVSDGEEDEDDIYEPMYSEYDDLGLNPFIVNADGKKLKAVDNYKNITYVGDKTYFLSRYLEQNAGPYGETLRRFDIVDYDLTKYIRGIPLVSEVENILGLDGKALYRRNHIDKLSIDINPLNPKNEKVLKYLIQIRNEYNMGDTLQESL